MKTQTTLAGALLLALLSPMPVSAGNPCEAALDTLTEILAEDHPTVEEIMEAGHEAAEACGYIDAVGATQADACYPHEFVPLACASASSSPESHDCRQTIHYYICDFTVTAGGSGSGLLSAGDIVVGAFDWTDDCHWITAGGACSVDSYSYELPSIPHSTEGCATTNTVTIVSVGGGARATAKGDCYS